MNKPRRSASPRVLLIAQDHLLEDTRLARVDFLATGITITPFREPRPLNAKWLLDLVVSLARYLSRRYDCLILPAVLFEWKHDASVARRLLRRFLVYLLRVKPDGRNGLVRWMTSRDIHISVLDRYDSDEVLHEYADLCSVDVYFKANLRREDAARAKGRTRVEFLPYWIDESKYITERQVDKDVDINLCFSINSESRRRAVAELEELRGCGVGVFSPSTRLNNREYVNLMRRSYLTLSPSGCGYHGFRHYEAMLCGSVPVIERAGTEYVTDLSDHETCLMYDSRIRGDLCRVVKGALDDRGHLLEWGRALREHALSRHSLSSVGEQVLRVILDDKWGSTAPGARGPEAGLGARRSPSR